MKPTAGKKSFRVVVYLGYAMVIFGTLFVIAFLSLPGMEKIYLHSEDTKNIPYAVMYFNCNMLIPIFIIFFRFVVDLFMHSYT